ncbi:MAG TPA: hypothetical protein VFL85_00540 [Candidatus Saccharimonadales bacterium]|nr:hypothetical protein [Candidatus Saccharimonadales bacterium]
MEIPKKYFQDKFVLLFLSINVFLMVLIAALIAFRIGPGHTDYIVQCRDCSNFQSISRFSNGSVLDIWAFSLFALAVTVFHTVLSIRLFKINRHVSVIVLAMGTLLLVISLIVSNALLYLR